MVKKFKVCKLGGTGCKYWSEPCMHCTQDKYKENPELCSMYPNMGEYTLEEIEEGKKQNIAYLKKMKKSSWGLINEFAKEATK